MSAVVRHARHFVISRLFLGCLTKIAIRVKTSYGSSCTNQYVVDAFHPHPPWLILRDRCTKGRLYEVTASLENNHFKCSKAETSPQPQVSAEITEQHRTGRGEDPLIPSGALSASPPDIRSNRDLSPPFLLSASTIVPDSCSCIVITPPSPKSIIVLGKRAL